VYRRSLTPGSAPAAGLSWEQQPHAGVASFR
jgi:hypothetical protein